MSGKHSPECRVGDCNECGDDPTSRANAIIRAKDAERKLAAAQAEIAELRDLNTTVRSVRVLRAVKERDAAQAEVAFKQGVIEEDNRGISNLRAEIARLKEELERADEANDESEQVRRVVAEAEAKEAKEALAACVAENYRVTRALSTVGGARDEALTEIAALRRVLTLQARAEAVRSERYKQSDNGWPPSSGWGKLSYRDECTAKDEARESLDAALSIPSAAEPLLADIRAAVLALARLREWLPQPTDVEDPDDLASLADDSDLSDAALTGLRRWVP